MFGRLVQDRDQFDLLRRLVFARAGGRGFRSHSGFWLGVLGWAVGVNAGLLLSASVAGLLAVLFITISHYRRVISVQSDKEMKQRKRFPTKGE